MKLLFVSTPVGALGSGIGGGVELTIRNMTQVMQERGHQVTIVAPMGSQISNPAIQLVEIAGVCQSSVQNQPRDCQISMPHDSLISNMWEYVRHVQRDYDLIVNMSYDWLPFYLTAFLTTPLAHLVSMGSLNNSMDDIIAAVAQRFPYRISVHTKTQADTFNCGDRFFTLELGLDLSLYEYCDRPQNQLCWMGRISPEKALEDAVEAANRTEMPLLVLGKIQDQDYFDRICNQYPKDSLQYCGFKKTQDMQEILRHSKALVATPRWIEAFGLVLVEALACGVPVIAYERGGPAEIVRSGHTGFLVTPDSIDGLVDAIGQISNIERHHCRQQAESQYSLEALGDRTEQWLNQVLTHA